MADLSGGERRRLQFLRLLLDEPNVLLLDEPTNDLDIDTLTVIEDYLDGWPGTLIVVTHDRYFLERVSDVTYALTGGGRCDCCRAASSSTWRTGQRLLRMGLPGRSRPRGESASARERRTGKEMARIEGQLSKLDYQIAALHESMAEAASDHVRLGELNGELQRAAGAQGISRRGLAGRRRGLIGMYVWATSAALDHIAAALPEPVVSISLRVWPPDFPDDIVVQLRSPRERTIGSRLPPPSSAARGSSSARWLTQHRENRLGTQVFPIGGQRVQRQPVDERVQPLSLVGEVGVGADELFVLQPHQHRSACVGDGLAERRAPLGAGRGVTGFPQRRPC